MVNTGSVGLARADLTKLGVEGMEVDALRGSRKTVQNLEPTRLVEILKSEQAVIKGLLDRLRCRYFPTAVSLSAARTNDPVLQHMSYRDGTTYLG